MGWLRLLVRSRWMRSTHRSIALQEGKVAVLVGTVTDDARLYDMPKMRVCALRFTETARARITKVRSIALPMRRLRYCARPCMQHDLLSRAIMLHNDYVSHPWVRRMCLVLFLQAGGECLTFDQLALERPTGKNCLLVRGQKTSREACKHFGPAPGGC